MTDAKDIGSEHDLDDGELLEEQEMVFEVTDVLDLHTFPPKEIPSLVRDYLDLAEERGYAHVRIIHGKGIGVQRRTVRAILDKDPRVVSYVDPEGFSGGWGATTVALDYVTDAETDAASEAPVGSSSGDPA